MDDRDATDKVDIGIDGTGKKFQVWDISTTAGASAVFGSEALQVKGSGFFGDNGIITAHLAASDISAYFTNGTFLAEHSAAQHAIKITEGADIFYVLRTGVYGLHIADESMTVTLADVNSAGQPWAINTTGGNGINIDDAYHVSDTQVVTSQQAAIADITVTGAARDGDCRQKVDDILAMLRVHGLVAT